MAAKSPLTPTSVRRREIIGGEQFSQRREVFDKHDTVFLPTPPANGKTIANFKRNTPGYSSMREPRNEEREPVRTRKYSDNLTSEAHQGDDDYRRSMTERTRRLSKLRRDFLTSNLHDNTDGAFTRSGTRASLPARTLSYKLDAPTIYKFPFPEPYTTPTPVRRVIVDLGSPDGKENVEVRDDKENQDPDKEKSKYQSLPNYDTTSKVDRQKLFEELVKRYSPNRKPVDWTLPPTRPRIVSTIPKTNKNIPNELHITENGDSKDKSNNNNSKSQNKNHHLPDVVVTEVSRDSKVSLTELAEKNDRVPEMAIIQRQLSREGARKTSVDKDLNIPALIERMTADGQDLEKHKNDNKKVKRKRSFIDKLLGRKKENKA